MKILLQALMLEYHTNIVLFDFHIRILHEQLLSVTLITRLFSDSHSGSVRKFMLKVTKNIL